MKEKKLNKKLRQVEEKETILRLVKNDINQNEAAKPSDDHHVTETSQTNSNDQFLTMASYSYKSSMQTFPSSVTHFLPLPADLQTIKTKVTTIHSDFTDKSLHESKLKLGSGIIVSKLFLRIED